jgi:hypothetical protein
MTVDWVETVGYGMYKNYKKRKEKIVRMTKTLVVTAEGRYDRHTGMNIDITNKSVGGFKLSEESKAAVIQK